MRKFKKSKYFKLSFKVFESNLKNILDFLDSTNQLTWFKNNKLWQIEIYSNFESEIDYLIKTLKKKNEIESIEKKTLHDKDWLLEGQKNNLKIKTDLFLISQNLNKSSDKKFYLKIPASTAFGTGSHSSTFLVIKAIEFLNKYKKFNNILDLGTGSGILSLVMSRLLKVKIVSSDFDEESKKNYLRNKRENEINNLFFIKAYSLRHYEFKSKRFDLVVANILLKPLIQILPSLKTHIRKKGYLILSGILENQLNQLYSYYYACGFIIIKKYISDGWATIILKENGKK